MTHVFKQIPTKCQACQQTLHVLVTKNEYWMNVYGILEMYMDAKCKRVTNRIWNKRVMDDKSECNCVLYKLIFEHKLDV